MCIRDRPIPIHFSSLTPRMSMLILAIPCLTTSSLPRLIDLTFQVPMQYFCLEHQTVLLLPGVSAAEHPFGFGPTTSLALELLVLVFHSSSVAHWMPSDLRGSSSSVISFSLLFLSMEFSWQRYWSGLPVPAPSGLHLVRTLHYDLSVLGVSARHSL